MVIELNKFWSPSLMLQDPGSNLLSQHQMIVFLEPKLSDFFEVDRSMPRDLQKSNLPMYMVQKQQP